MVKQVHALAVVAWFVVGHGVLKVISLRGGNIAQGIAATADQAENIKSQHGLPVVCTLEPLSAYKDIRGRSMVLHGQKAPPSQLELSTAANRLLPRIRAIAYFVRSPCTTLVKMVAKDVLKA